MSSYLSPSLLPGPPGPSRHPAGHAGRPVQQAVEQVAAAAGGRRRRQGLPPVEEEPDRLVGATLAQLGLTRVDPDVVGSQQQQ